MLDLGIDLNLWPWIWLGLGIFFAAIELTVLAGSFVLLPFALSAFIAALLGFYDVPIEVQWFVFIFGGALLWFLFYRFAQRWVGNNDVAPGVGADRLVGLTAIVTHDIDPDDTDRRGRVSVEGETWGALTDHEHPIRKGSKVKVVEMTGTRVKVEPLPTHHPFSPPDRPPQRPPDFPMEAP